jgi:protein-export membrane protein SecD
MAALFGFIFVILFLIIWYRLPGFLAGLALCMYAVIILTLFKLIPVTLSAAGIAGFVMSLGIAVDANILIFERMKEELRNGRTLYDAMHEGFKRAWSSIRDSNISSIISGLVLFWFGSSLIKGFALTFCLGVIVSMFTAITVSRTFLYAVGGNSNNKIMRFLYSSSFNSGKSDQATS